MWPVPIYNQFSKCNYFWTFGGPLERVAIHVAKTGLQNILNIVVTEIKSLQMQLVVRLTKMVIVFIRRTDLQYVYFY